MHRPAEQRAAVVYNPLKVDLEKLKKTVSEAAHRAGWESTLWFTTSEENAGQAATGSALRHDATLVIAAGGDGTVRAVAEGLRGSGVPLAVLPFGTGNLLARNLSIPVTGLDAAIGIAFHGDDRAIDLGITRIVRDDGSEEENVFLVVAGLGLDAKMIAKTNTRLKKAVGWLAYVDAGLRSLPEVQPMRIHYRLNHAAERSLNVHSLLIGNCGALPGGLLLIPDARPDDGILDFVALRPKGPFGWIKVWNIVAWENRLLRRSALGQTVVDLTKDAKDVSYFRGKDLVVSVDVSQDFQLDGDEFGKARSVHAWLEPGGLTVKVPKH